MLGLDLLTPEDHANAYEWAAVALAHMSVGMVLTASVAVIIGFVGEDVIERTGRLSLLLVASLYLLIWEMGAQGFGAGVPDAILDTAMVGAGGALGLLLWRRKGAQVAALLALICLTLYDGIRRRK